MRRFSVLFPTLFCCAALSAGELAAAVIRVVDDQTGRGVPLVELRTTGEQTFVTDSAGVVAIQEPDLLGRKVFFSVSSHGYSFPKDGFGQTGRALELTPGSTHTLKLTRVNIAERLYRVTGGGIYAESVKAGLPVPLKQPLLNGEVTGQDSIQMVAHRGKLWWFWGDTFRLSYGLGHFGTSGATSLPPDAGGLDPAVGVELTYFTKPDGFSRPMVEAKEPGLLWVDAVCVLPDAAGREHIAARVTRSKKLGEVLSRHAAVFNEERGVFELRAALPPDAHAQPDGCATRHGAYVYFACPYPVLRAPAALDAFGDPAKLEAFTCLKAGSVWRGKTSEIERDANGAAVWAWKASTAPLDPKRQAELLQAGVLKPAEKRLALLDAENGRDVRVHTGSANYNAHRKKWILLAVEEHGEGSYLGEVWYAEAAAPEGPWRNARKIVTHDTYTFYNVRQHPMFDQQDGRFVYFEGTYTTMFSGNRRPTPRYEYNQIMYRLDLADPRLKLPAP